MNKTAAEIQVLENTFHCSKKLTADKISEHLYEDQERAATVGVPSKVLAYPDDAIGKVYGVEHSGRVCGLGVGVCPSNVFGLRRHSTDYTKLASSSQKDVEDLKKNVETLEEKLNGYEETNEQLEQTQSQLEDTKEHLTQTQNQLTFLQKFLHHKFGDELPSFNQGVAPS
ncbi:hypothetical protein SESBI_50761 [Sesbania bispinosa]|nr:hypothetical protein SESBI_50761 [Sesbania bispinosa]